MYAQRRCVFPYRVVHALKELDRHRHQLLLPVNKKQRQWRAQLKQQETQWRSQNFKYCSVVYFLWYIIQDFVIFLHNILVVA